MKHLALVMVFVACLVGAVEHKHLHITTGATTALIIGCVLSFLALINDD